MKRTLRSLTAGSVILLFIILILLLPASAAPAAKKTVSDAYADPAGRLLIVSDKGYTRELPENTLYAIIRADELGADIVRIDVKMTADGGLVVFADDTLTRMTGGKRTERVSDLDIDEITKIPLTPVGAGDLHAAYSIVFSVPALLAVLETKDLSCILMLTAPWQYRDALYDLVKDKYLDRVILQFTDAKVSDVSGWLSGLDKKPDVCLYHKGNVIFGARSFVKKAADAGVSSLWLASRVPYSVSFSKAVTGLAGGRTRLMLDLTDGEKSGRLRADSESWYDEALCRGFNMIMTDDIPGAVRYRERCVAARESLSRAVDDCVNRYALPDFSSDTFAAYKKAWSDAKTAAETLLADAGAAASEMENAAAALYSARDDIIKDYDELKTGRAGVTVTPGRVAAAVIAVCAVCAFEVFIYRKKKK